MIKFTKHGVIAKTERSGNKTDLEYVSCQLFPPLSIVTIIKFTECRVINI